MDPAALIRAYRLDPAAHMRMQQLCDAFSRERRADHGDPIDDIVEVSGVETRTESRVYCAPCEVERLLAAVH